ncbi:type II toxin-antitoxin system RelE/ParE family toxin [Opitutia bacterium ISCC 51]|nr:type II toxin-antitoxin system RelE/ParE family toxin [Opitutae bacterium ISCC 51]QXD27641.1 type II toxin-antitoxin system RelE/ParE family toxin [Opitutae bacterium ISCC 52]
MIESFGDKETESVFSGIRSRKLPNDIQQRVRRKLRMIDQAHDMRDLRIPPSNHLESLRGEFKGFWSIRVNDQWRIMFRWEEGIKRDVSIIDYH